MTGDTKKVWKDIELRIYPDPSCTLCQISSINKKAGSKNLLKPNAPFKWIFMDIIPEIARNVLTSGTTLSNYLLVVDAYLKPPKLYGAEIITTEEVMDKLDIFQSRFVRIDEFGWWDLEIISADAGTQFTSTEFQDEFQTHGVNMTLEAPENQEMNIQVEVKRRTLRTIAHSIMIYAIVLEA